MTQFVKKYNIIVRPHPLEIDPQYDRYNPKVHKIILESDFIVSDDAYQNMSELYLIADYVFCDYGGTIFSALYLDKRILLMNHENVFKDLPVFGSTSMEVRNYLPSININETKSFFEDFSNENFWIDRENLRQEGRHYYFGNNKIDSAKKTANKILEILRNV
jgi:CDP-glycerol glycerophosphotransferase (TagB/SpsB family)